ncbi:MAG: hypothetical protein WAN36_05245, partial [Calditrichia bacterium]
MNIMLQILLVAVMTAVAYPESYLYQVLEKSDTSFVEWTVTALPDNQTRITSRNKEERIFQS